MTRVAGTKVEWMPHCAAQLLSGLVPVDFRLLDLRAIESAWGRRFDGIVGFDVLCHTTVEIDYAKKTLTIGGKPSGEALPLTFNHGWSFVKGTIKVPGNEPVTDWFLIDTGSQDTSIIRSFRSRAVRSAKSGEGSIGAPSSAVVGDTEWFRIGSLEIGSTSSSCCGNPETARLMRPRRSGTRQSSMNRSELERVAAGDELRV